MMIALNAMMAQSHNIQIMDTVYTGSYTNVINHEEVETVWSLYLNDDIPAWPYFCRNFYIVGVPNLPEATYEISCELNLEEWYEVENTEMQLLHTIDSDGVGFIINEHQSNEDLITTMIYRDSVESVVLRYTGPISTIRFVTSTSMLKYYGLTIKEVVSHNDTVTITRVAVEGNENDFIPNPTTNIVHFGTGIQFDVYSQSGNKVYSGISDYFSFEEWSLPSGTYFIRNKNNGTTTKVVYLRN